MRDGFFANKKYSDLNSLQKGLHLESGFNRAVPIREFDVDFSGYVFPRSDGSAVVSVVMEAPVNFEDKAEFEIYGVVIDKDEKLIDVAHKTIKFASADTSKRFHFIQTFNMEAGANIIKIVLRDNLSGARCYHFLDARMPILPDGINASSVIFETEKLNFLNNSSARGKSFRRDYPDIETGEAVNPLEPMLRKGIAVNASNAVPAGNQSFMLKLSGVNLENPAILLTAKVRSAAGEETELQVSKPEIVPVNRSGEAFARASVNLSGLKAGKYTINVTVIHTDSKDVVVQAAEIEVK